MGNDAFSRLVSFKKKDAAKQIVYGEVYAPWTGAEPPPLKQRDTDGQWATAVEIEKMAHKFMENLRLTQIDKNHEEEADEGVVVESFIARAGDPDFTVGSWVVGTKIIKAETWAAIEKGDITGYSMAGDAIIIPDDEPKGGE